MQAIEYRRLAKIEKFHWWYQSIHSLVLGLVKNILQSTVSYKETASNILDAGCGTGGLTSKLTKLGKVTGMDISPLALSLVAKSSVSYVNGSVNELPFRPNNFDIVTSISVLYHKQVNDRAALKETYRTMRKNGWLIIVLPAFECLFSKHDEAVHTSKRYTLKQTRELTEKAGFEYIAGRYIFSFLFPIFIIKRMMEKLNIVGRTASDLEEMPKLVNSILIYMCKIEWAITRYIKLPFGSSLMVIARK